MSRALKRMLEAKDEPVKPKPVEEESEDEDDAPTGFVNPFDLLNQGGGNDEDEESEEEDPKPVQPVKPASAKQPSAKNNNKKKKKKGKANKPDPQQTEEKEEDIDQLVKELGIDNTRSELEQAESEGLVENLLSLQAVHLDADAEMRKLFGPGVIPKEKRDPRIKRVAHKKALIIKPKDFWPRMSSGLSMDLIDSKAGVNYFKINWSKEYKEVQKQFIACVNTGDPNTLGQLLHVHPYHIDTLLQLAEAFKFMGEMDSSIDLNDRALYAFECSWHSLFNPVTHNNQRLEYKHPENRSFFLSMFKHIQDLGRRGCSRTALEFCKLMLKLDPSDPLGVLYLIDTYAIRARQYEFLIEFTYSKMFQDRSLSYLPNFAMHVALAKFYLEKEGAENNNTANKKSLRMSSNKLLSSVELLQNALMLFPMVLAPMLKKMSINSLMHREADGTSSDVMLHGYFTSLPFVPPAVQYLAALFVERNAALWRDPDVVTWLKENAIKTKVRAESQDPMVENCAVILREEHQTVEPNVYRHLLLTDDNEVVNSLPAEVINEGFRIYDDEEEKEYRAQDNNPRNTTVNAIGALLSSILPWNTRPTGEWLSELLNRINTANAEGGEENAGNNGDVNNNDLHGD